MTDDAFELIRLREALKWYWKHTGRLYEELRAEQAIADFWDAEAERSSLHGDFQMAWDRWQGATSWTARVSADEQIPAIVSWHARRGR